MQDNGQIINNKSRIGFEAMRDLLWYEYLLFAVSCFNYAVSGSFDVFVYCHGANFVSNDFA